MGLLSKVFGALRRLRPSSRREFADTNVISLSATKKGRAEAAEKQRRAQVEADRLKRWNAPTKRK